MKGEHESHLIFCQQPTRGHFNSTFIVMSYERLAAATDVDEKRVYKTEINGLQHN
jgi:hypothetical protein